MLMDRLMWKIRATNFTVYYCCQFDQSDGIIMQTVLTNGGLIETLLSYFDVKISEDYFHVMSRQLVDDFFQFVEEGCFDVIVFILGRCMYMDYAYIIKNTF